MYSWFTTLKEAIAFRDEYNTDREKGLAKLVAWPYSVLDTSKYGIFCPLQHNQ